MVKTVFLYINSALSDYEFVFSPYAKSTLNQNIHLLVQVDGIGFSKDNFNGLFTLVTWSETSN